MFEQARPHRFPPLSQVRSLVAADGGTAEGAGAPVAGQLQAAVAAGFQEGLAKGYDEGLASGHEAGLARGLQEGRQQSRQQALDEARREGQALLEALATPLEAVLSALKQQRADYQSAQRREVVELVAKVARQVIRCELALQPTQLLALVDETLATLPPARDEDIEVFLNPEELVQIRELDPARAERLHLHADAALAPGECRVRAGGREADAGCKQRLAACMEQIERQLGLVDSSEPAPSGAEALTGGAE